MVCRLDDEISFGNSGGAAIQKDRDNVISLLGCPLEPRQVRIDDPQTRDRTGHSKVKQHGRAMRHFSYGYQWPPTVLQRSWRIRHVFCQ